MDSSSNSFRRITSRIRQTIPFDDNARLILVTKINKYFLLKPIQGSLGNEANFEQLKRRVNDFYKKRSGKKEDIIDNKYIYEIHSGISKAKSKRRVKIEALDAFLDYFTDPNNTSFLDTEQLRLPDWKGSVDTMTPQWADHKEIEMNGRVFKSLSCLVQTKSPYYRFGIKLFSSDSKLFGDGSIQSQKGSNILIHIAKDFLIDELYVCSYKNGIPILRSHFINKCATEDQYSFHIVNRNNEFLLLSIDNEEVYRVPIIPDMLARVCLYVWGDGHKPDPKVSVTNIFIETREA